MNASDLWRTSRSQSQFSSWFSISLLWMHKVWCKWRSLWGLRAPLEFGQFWGRFEGFFLRRLYLSEWCGDTSPAPLPHTLEPVATWRTQISIFITDWSWRSVVTLLSIPNSEIIVLELLRGWCKQRRIRQPLPKQQIYCTLTTQRKSFAFQSNCFTFILEKCSLL